MPEEALAAFTAPLTLRECGAIAQIVDSELTRRGLRRVRVGGRFYRAMEAIVITRLVTAGADMYEIASQVEEARREAEWESCQ